MYNRHRGFTLIELLVVVAIIALLLGIMIPALGKARDVAAQVRGMSDLRQMMLGYGMYQHDHDGRVLLGYTPPTIAGKPVTVQTDSGISFGLPIADRYPWRLAPYVDNVWGILHSHRGEVPPLPIASDSQADAVSKAYTLSITPTFGINSVFVGGHYGPFGGFRVDSRGNHTPNTGGHVVFRTTEVHRPSQLIVFTEVQARVGNKPPFENPHDGFHYVMPPNAKGDQWREVDGTIESQNLGMMQGLPLGRFGNRTITGFFDSHIETMSAGELDDMTLWANEATDNDYDVP